MVIDEDLAFLLQPFARLRRDAHQPQERLHAGRQRQGDDSRRARFERLVALDDEYRPVEVEALFEVL